MNIVERAKNILLSPKTEWPVIAGEASTPGSLMTYAAILALIPAVAGLIGSQLMLGRYGVSLGMGFFLTIMIVGYVVGLVLIYVMGLIADALAPSFGGTASGHSGLKLVAYSGTAVWVAGILGLIPTLAIIGALAGLAYAGYLMYIGCQTVHKIPADKAAGFIAVLVVAWLVLGFIVNTIAQSIAWSIAGPQLVIPFG